MQVNDKVTIRETVDPSDKRIGTVRAIESNYKVKVDWNNNCRFTPTNALMCECESVYVANLEIYKEPPRPFTVGDEIYLNGNRSDWGKIVYIYAYNDFGNNKEYVVHNYSDPDDDDLGLDVYMSTDSFTHRN